MSQPFLGQLQAFGFGYAPKGWALCNGQQLPINQYAALFALLGVTYGGNGTTTFNLPNLQSRVPMHFGTSQMGGSYALGQIAGSESVTLTPTTIPAHTHSFLGSSANAQATVPPLGSVLAKATLSSTPNNFYGPDATLQPLSPAVVSPVGSTLPHTNIQPYLAINWCIALVGIFPSRN